MPTREELITAARRIAGERGIDPEIFIRLIQQESGFNPEAENPISKAWGLGQFVPKWYPEARTWTPLQQLDKAAAILAHNYEAFGGDWPLAVAAYNAGEQAMKNWLYTYGESWRQALTRYPGTWRANAGYGDASKASEVKRYLDVIIGAQEEQAPMPGIIDFRGQLPTRPGAAYTKRPVSGIVTATYHYTASDPNGTIKSIAEWQISDAAAAQFGGTPAPGLAYTGIVPGSGVPYLCWGLDVRVWHAGSGWNDTSVGLCYIGNGPPTTKQIDGLAVLHVHCERQLGRQLGVRAHKDGFATACPGGWPDWRSLLLDAINRARAGDQPAPPPPIDHDAVWPKLVRAFEEIRAAADRGALVSTPGLIVIPNDPNPLTPERSIAEIGRCLELIDRERLIAVDALGQMKS